MEAVDSLPWGTTATCWAPRSGWPSVLAPTSERETADPGSSTARIRWEPSSRLAPSFWPKVIATQWQCSIVDLPRKSSSHFAAPAAQSSLWWRQMCRTLFAQRLVPPFQGTAMIWVMVLREGHLNVTHYRSILIPHLNSVYLSLQSLDRFVFEGILRCAMTIFPRCVIQLCKENRKLFPTIFVFLARGSPWSVFGLLALISCKS